MTPTDPIGVGIVGFGLAGSTFHAPLVASTPGLRIAAIVTSDPGRAERARTLYPPARIEPSMDRLLAVRGDLGLIVVAAPNRFHVPLAESALDAGLPVVVDKPLAPSAEAARVLIERAKRAGLLLTAFHNRRWDGDFLTLERLIRRGDLGSVRRFESRFERWRPEPKPGWRQRSDPEDAGGVLFDLGSHLVDQALRLFGPVDSVYGELDPGYPGAVVDDDSFLALVHASGVRSHLWASSVAARPGPRFRVLGDRAGWIRHGLDPQEAALREGRRPDDGDVWGVETGEGCGTLGAGDTVEEIASVPGDYPAFYRLLETALREGGPPPVDPMDAVRGLEILEAARRSAASGTIEPPRREPRVSS